ncbi:MAG: hypothetical protein PHZ26_04435 [Candidatus Gracilibacteria bacterium]|nr:hypothetical protein [Candidatus Gracilibacteria bacterium]MDD2908976.1 hypothetical protein [Candidatus Gracilibacteria bacterium]
MEELNKKNELDQAENKNEVIESILPKTNIFDFSRKTKPFLLANPNRSIGKGMHATHQTKRPHKPRKKK